MEIFPILFYISRMNMANFVIWRVASIWRRKKSFILDLLSFEKTLCTNAQWFPLLLIALVSNRTPASAKRSRFIVLAGTLKMNIATSN